MSDDTVGTKRILDGIPPAAIGEWLAEVCMHDSGDRTMSFAECLTGRFRDILSAINEYQVETAILHLAANQFRGVNYGSEQRLLGTLARGILTN